MYINFDDDDDVWTSFFAPFSIYSHIILGQVELVCHDVNNWEYRLHSLRKEVELKENNNIKQINKK